MCSASCCSPLPIQRSLFCCFLVYGVALLHKDNRDPRDLSSFPACLGPVPACQRDGPTPTPTPASTPAPTLCTRMEIVPVGQGPKQAGIAPASQAMTQPEDPSSIVLPRSSAAPTPAAPRRSLALLPEAIITLTLLTFGLAMFTIDVPQGRVFFIERDPALSRRATLTETVSRGMLAVYAAIIPFLVLALLSLWVSFQVVVVPPGKTRGPAVLVAAVRLLALLVVGLGQAMAVALVAIGVLKVATAEPRPGFFYLCNYAGYRTALDSGTFTPYFGSTVAGVPGTLSKCQDSGRVQNAVQGWPSGHAAIAFAGLGFLALALLWGLGTPLWGLGTPGGRFFGMRAFLALSFLVLAAWIGVTRITNGYHAPFAVSTGSAIGALGAVLGWRNFEQRTAAYERHAPLGVQRVDV